MSWTTIGSPGRRSPRRAKTPGRPEGVVDVAGDEGGAELAGHGAAPVPEGLLPDRVLGRAHRRVHDVLGRHPDAEHGGGDAQRRHPQLQGHGHRARPQGEGVVGERGGDGQGRPGCGRLPPGGAGWRPGPSRRTRPEAPSPAGWSPRAAPAGAAGPGEHRHRAAGGVASDRRDRTTLNVTAPPSRTSEHREPGDPPVGTGRPRCEVRRPPPGAPGPRPGPGSGCRAGGSRCWRTRGRRVGAAVVPVPPVPPVPVRGDGRCRRPRRAWWWRCCRSVSSGCRRWRW